MKTDKQYVGTPKITFTATYYTWRSASQKRDAVGTSGLEVYIDGVVQSFPYAMHPGTPYTVNYSLPQLPNANNVHQVMWVYSQSPTAQPAYVVLQDVTIEGTEIGIALVFSTLFVSARFINLCRNKHRAWQVHEQWMDSVFHARQKRTHRIIP